MQSFKRYAEKVKWNVIDQLIVASTELDPLNTFIVDQLREKNTKYKRLLFAILPPALPAQCRPTAREWLKLHLSKERTTTEALPDHREQGRYRQARRFEVPFFLLLTATTCSLPRFACATQCRRRPPTTRSTSAICASTSPNQAAEQRRPPGGLAVRPACDGENPRQTSATLSCSKGSRAGLLESKKDSGRDEWVVLTVS